MTDPLTTDKKAEQQQEIADQIKTKFAELGNLIEQARELDLMTSAEIWFHGGSEATTLHGLNGEITPTVGIYVEL